MAKCKHIKVIHVHFLNGRRNYYFGSVSAVFQKFSESDLGCTEAYLQHVLTADGSSHLSSTAFIVRSHLIQKERGR